MSAHNRSSDQLDVAGLIRTRGFWHVIIRPATYDPGFVPYVELEHLIASTRVSIRGWDLPHVEDPNPIQRGSTWIGRDVAWDYHLEVWRLYQSGQFVHLNSLRNDWHDRSALSPAPPGWQPGTALGVGDALYTLGEYYEFASRLSLALPGEGALTVHLRLQNLAGRELTVNDPRRASFDSRRSTQMDTFDTGERDFTVEQLVADPRSLAVDTACELFARFGWDASPDLLRDHLEELWNWRSR